MKKHKVEIPEGYEVASTIKNIPIMTSAPPSSITINLRPIKKQLPKTWEEYCEKNEFPAWLENWAKIPARHKALGKLEILRDHYNDGYDYNLTEEDKYIFINPVSIYRKSGSNEIIMGGCGRGPLILHHDIALEFYTNFTDLLETAKPLL